MEIDHVVMLVADATRTVERFRSVHGLGSEASGYLPLAGTRAYSVPLEPPAYLEFHTIENREVAERTNAGRVALACEAAGYGWFSWSVRVDDLEAVSERLGLEIFDYTVPHGDGTSRGWRTVSGPPNLPFFIDYPNNGDRVGRWRSMYERVGHSSAPRGISQLTIGGDRGELADWLGPNDLPLHVADGGEGIRDVRIASAHDELVIDAETFR